MPNRELPEGMQEGLFEVIPLAWPSNRVCQNNSGRSRVNEAGTEQKQAQAKLKVPGRHISVLKYRSHKLKIQQDGRWDKQDGRQTVPAQKGAKSDCECETAGRTGSEAVVRIGIQKHKGLTLGELGECPKRRR